MTVVDKQKDPEDRLWFLVQLEFEGRVARQGWVLNEVVVELTTCPTN